MSKWLVAGLVLFIMEVSLSFDRVIAASEIGADAGRLHETYAKRGYVENRDYMRGYAQAMIDSGAIPVDEVTIRQERGKGNKIIFIVGDSISFGAYFSADFKSYPSIEEIARPDKLCNLLAKENGFPVYYVSISATPFRLLELMDIGIICGGDTVIIQDAGPHPESSIAYKYILSLYKFFSTVGPYYQPRSGLGVDLFFTTTFDSSPIYKNSAWELAAPDGRSMNQMIRDVAKNKEFRKAHLLPVKEYFDRAMALTQGTEIKLMFDDGIHYTLAGNLVFSRALLEGLGYKPKKFQVVASRLNKVRTALPRERMGSLFKNEKIPSDGRDWISPIVGRILTDPSLSLSKQQVESQW